MHHGHYGKDGTLKKNKHQAQIDMIEELLDWSGVQIADRILDAGCGVGGSARYLSKKFDAEVLGCTLSPVQVARGQLYNNAAGLENRIQLIHKDMMNLNEQEGSFNLIWSMESAEHIQNKKELFNIFYDRLQPGGHLIMATWCHRQEPPQLSDKEKALLNKIGALYHLPPMTSISNLAEMSKKAGFQSIKTDDWSASVAPFWGKVIGTALTPRGLWGLMQSGLGTAKGAWAMRYMKKGYELGLIRFGVLHAIKPADS